MWFSYLTLDVAKGPPATHRCYTAALIVTRLFVIENLSLTANNFMMNYMGTAVNIFTSVFLLVFDVNLA